jgi:hypothetical protein
VQHLLLAGPVAPAVPVAAPAPPPPIAVPAAKPKGRSRVWVVLLVLLVLGGLSIAGILVVQQMSPGPAQRGGRHIHH